MTNTTLNSLFLDCTHTARVAAGDAMKVPDDVKRAVDIALLAHRLYTADELARARGVSKRTVFRWAAKHGGRADALGAAFRAIAGRKP